MLYTILLFDSVYLNSCCTLYCYLILFIRTRVVHYTVIWFCLLELVLYTILLFDSVYRTRVVHYTVIWFCLIITVGVHSDSDFQYVPSNWYFPLVELELLIIAERSWLLVWFGFSVFCRWLLCCLCLSRLVIVLAVLLQYMASDNPLVSSNFSLCFTDVALSIMIVISCSL